MSDRLVRSDVERALFGDGDVSAIDEWLDRVAKSRLGWSVDRIVFRSGRIDAVYALGLTDGSVVVVKVHRPPVDLSSLLASRDAVRHLHNAGYPCPEPLDGPVGIDQHIVSIDSLLTAGRPADARVPTIRAAMTASLAEHIELLRSVPEGVDALAARIGPGPAWTRHGDGPWPRPHDSAYDFSTTPEGWGWLDEYAREATTDLRRLAGASRKAVAHADWYAGNLRFTDDRVVAAFDWEVFVEQEAVVAGLSAGGYLTDDAPTAEEVSDYLDDYAKASPLNRKARQAAAAAARWMLSFNARCDLATLSGDPPPGSALGRLVHHRDAYRAVAD